MRFIASPTAVEMFGTAYRINAYGYSRVNAYSSFDNDVAQLTGSSSNDTFTSNPESSSLVGSGYRLITNGFDRVSAVGGGGTDIANLYDSQYDDLATVGYHTANLRNYFSDNTVTDFDRIQLYASQGNDVARVSGTAGNDKFSARSRLAPFPALVSWHHFSDSTRLRYWIAKVAQIKYCSTRSRIS